MKKTLLTLLVSVSISGIFAENSWVMGKDYVSQLQTEYLSGAFDPFLETIQQDFEEYIPHFALPQEDTLAKLWENPPESLKQYIEQYGKLREKFTSELKEIAEENPNLFITYLINNALLSRKPPKEEEISEIMKALRNQQDPIAKEFYSQFQEFQIKQALLNSRYTAGKLEGEEQHEKLQMALFFNYAESLKTLIEKYPHHIVSKFYEKEISYENLAMLHDYQLLIDLGNGKRKPENSVEKRIGELMKQYEEDQLALLEKV